MRAMAICVLVSDVTVFQAFVVVSIWYRTQRLRQNVNFGSLAICSQYLHRWNMVFLVASQTRLRLNILEPVLPKMAIDVIT